MERELGAQAKRTRGVTTASMSKSGSIRGRPGEPDVEKRFILDPHPRPRQLLCGSVRYYSYSSHGAFGVVVTGREAWTVSHRRAAAVCS